jgi:hypothetical protein
MKSERQPDLIWRVPGFAALWAGQTVSAFGSYITSTAIPLAALLVLRATPVQMGVLTAAAVNGFARAVRSRRFILNFL